MRNAEGEPFHVHKHEGPEPGAAEIREFTLVHEYQSKKSYLRNDNERN